MTADLNPDDVEIAARAIREIIWDRHDWDQIPDETREYWRIRGRAVVAALAAAGRLREAAPADVRDETVDDEWYADGRNP